MKVSLSAICAYFHVSRSWYYKILSSLEKRLEFETTVLLAIGLIRREHPFYGLLKVWYEIKHVHNILIGRDHLHRLMQEHGLMLPRRYKAIRTTVPGTLLPSVENKIKHLDVVRKDQVWVTDITYIQTYDGVIYLSVIMDLWSRKIVAYHVSYDLKAESSLECLQKALNTVDDPMGLIHHSDRGVQYCSYLYVNHLLANGLDPSYTGKDHCYDNANVERFFNTLKYEYGLHRPLSDRRLTKRIISSAIEDYNYGRIHEALSYKKPGEVYDAA